MAQPSLIINRGQGGLGRPLAGKDHISGISYYHNHVSNLPTGFGADRIKQIFSTKGAEDLGIIEGDADWGVLWYHISEFFRIQPKGVLWVQINAGDAVTIPNYNAHTFAELTTLRREAEGVIRQIGVFAPMALFATTQVTALQAEITAASTEKMPLSIVYAADFVSFVDLSTLPDLRALAAAGVSVVVGEDGAAAGAALAVSTGKSVTTLGATLGAISFASVNESIAWVEKFNLVTGDELEVAAFANGDLLKSKAESFLDALNDKGYIFLRKFTNIGLAGTYFNDTPTAITVTSDYAYIENNRTIDKAIRNLRTFLTPKLNSPLVVNADGTLFEDTVAVFDSLSRQALNQMATAQEVSAFDVIIDPTQNVLSTSKMFISVKIVPVGVARTIEFEVGFSTSI